MTVDRTDVFDAVSALLRPYARPLIVKSDSPTNFYLEETMSSGKPTMFAAVQAKASYVALHVFPVYVRPDLLGAVGAPLRARMQGKSCFNFKSLDQVPQDEVASLLEAAYLSIGGGSPV